jgi:hypothetical protein
MHQLQVPLGEVEVFRGCLQIAVAEQNLNGAQIRSGFEQMGGPTVAQRVGRNALANGRALRGFAARYPHGLVRDGLLNLSMSA